MFPRYDLYTVIETLQVSVGSRTVSQDSADDNFRMGNAPDSLLAASSYRARYAWKAKGEQRQMNIQGIACGGVYCGNLVSRAIASGHLRRPDCFRCVDCGKPATQYEHRDYNRPLKVDPVCRTCNRRRGAAIPKRWKGLELFSIFMRCRTYYQNHASSIIDAMGGTTKVAVLCRVSPSTVSCWRERGIPRAWKLHLENLRQKSPIVRPSQK